MILQRLREATTEYMNCFENGLSVAQLAQDPLRYIQHLTGLYCFYSTAEPVLGRWRQELGAHRLEKTDWLLDDLLELGVCADELKSLAQLGRSIPINSLAEAYGCLYAMENETHGGRFMRDHLLHSNLGLPCRYFEGYGELSRDRWFAFVTALEQFSASHQEDAAIINAAVATYRQMVHCVRNDRALAA